MQADIKIQSVQVYVEVHQNRLTLEIVGVVVIFEMHKSLFSYSLDPKKPVVKINYPYFDVIKNEMGLLVCKLRRSKLGSQNFLLMLLIANCLFTQVSFTFHNSC